MIDATNGLPVTPAPSPSNTGMPSAPVTGLASTATVAQPPTDTSSNTASHTSASPKGPRRKLNPIQIALGVAAMAVLLVGGVVGAVLVQQNQDTRQQAQGGFTEPKDCSWHGNDCKCTFCVPGQPFNCQWNPNPVDAGLCPGGGGTQPSPPPGGGGNSNTCYPGSPTAQSCQGQAVNSRCNGFAGTCVANGDAPDGYKHCGCIPDQALDNGQSCTANSNCRSNYCHPTTRLCAPLPNIGNSPNPSSTATPLLCVIGPGDNLPVGQSRCYANTKITCNAGGQTSGENCAATGKVCQNGQCVTPTGGATPTPGTGGPNGGMCTNSPTTPVAKYVKFTCPNGCFYGTEGGVPDWRCYGDGTAATRQESTTPLTLAPGECGQVDQLSGSTDNTFCGIHQINCDGSCRNQTASPPPSTPPHASPPASTAPLACLNISIYNKTANSTDQTRAPQIGETVQFVCGQVAGAARYIFRVIENDGVIVNLNPTAAGSRNSMDYLVRKGGRFTAQCQICTGTADSTCAAYPTVN